VFMSGGLDSTALAATASDLLRCRAVANPVRAFTFVYDSLFEDSEREYAGRVARHLKIPIHYYALDARDNGVPSDTTRMPEPVQTSPDYETELSCYAAMSTHSRVAFYGEGPDNALLYEWRPHLTYLLRNRRFARLTADLVKHVVSHKRVPLLPTIPRMLRDRKFQKQHEAPFPEWLAPDLVHRLQLRRRWQDLENVSDSPHPTRPRGYASLLTAQWQSIFETNEPSYTGVALEVRHPFVDIRLLRFLLRIPAVPWCRSKYLLRRALRGIIPEAVRRRPKTPLSSNPDYELFRRCGLPAVRPSALLTRYRNTRAQLESDSATIPAISAGFRFVALSYWLSDSQSVRIRQEEEKGHGLAATLASFAGG
jgi:asparagine synthase (glutamine-hydrolysing)